MLSAGLIFLEKIGAISQSFLLSYCQLFVTGKCNLLLFMLRLINIAFTALALFLWHACVF